MPVSVIENVAADWIKAALALLVFITPVIIAWFRSGSTHIVWSRLWKLIDGKGVKPQSTLQRFLAERDTLMEFRVRTGVRARTTRIAMDIRKWCADHNEEIGDVGRCGAYFDTEAVDLKTPPSWRRQALIYFVMASLFFISIILASTIIVPRLWSIVPSGDGPLVSLGVNDAKIWRTGYRFSLDDCSAANTKFIAKASGISNDDVEIICSWLKDRDFKSNLPSQINAQRLLSALLFGFLLFPLFIFFKLFSSGIYASRMYKRQMARSSKSSSSEHGAVLTVTSGSLKKNTVKRVRSNNRHRSQR